MMRMIAGAALVALMVLSTTPQAGAQPAGNGHTVTVTLSNFDFNPGHLRLKAGGAVRLRLVNESSGGHDFSAPAFFAASAFPPGIPEPPDGDIEVGPHQTVEIDVIPRTPGTYRLRCTHFLHGLFGMHGTIEIVP